MGLRLKGIFKKIGRSLTNTDAKENLNRSTERLARDRKKRSLELATLRKQLDSNIRKTVKGLILGLSDERRTGFKDSPRDNYQRFF